MGVIDSRFLERKDVIDMVVPVGVSYIQFAGYPLPGDELLSYEDAVIEDYTDEELEACLYPGTKWKLAVRNGDFLRQKGIRVIDEENVISIGSENIGIEQDDAMQRITGSFASRPFVNTDDSDGVFTRGVESPKDSQPGSSSTTYSEVVSFDSSNSTSPYSAKTDDYETRPTNTSVAYWVRVA